MLSAREFIQFERHIELPEVGEAGQEKLRNSKVLIVGAGGLGCPVCLYLGAAGIGHITIVDDDTVSLSNLQRQIAFSQGDIKNSKANILGQRIQAINPEAAIMPRKERLDSTNIDPLMFQHDIIIDATDNFNTRYLLNEKSMQYSKPLISGSVLEFDGQVSVFKPYISDNPCYNCLYPYKPESHEVPTCSESAVLGPVPGIIGTIMATETIKEILSIGQSLAGHLLIYSGLNSSFRKMKIEKNPDCSVCSGAIAYNEKQRSVS